MQAEKAHHFTFRMLQIAQAIPGMGRLIKAFFTYRHPRLEREVFGLKFPNPVGLAAGFDKDGKLINMWGNLGFGFIEIGTVTPLPQDGNPQPRLFRLPKDQAVINRMGFNNQGLEALVGRLKKKNGRLIIGGNIGKNKLTPNEEAISDYEKCFEALYPHVDYFVVNVSSPNTPNLRELQEKEPLQKLLQHIQSLNLSKEKPKPVLLKIAPDLSDGQLDDIIDIVEQVGIAGLIATNTTISREGLKSDPGMVEQIGMGGLSGKPLRERSTEVISYISTRSKGKIPVIAVGGIFSGKDAIEKLHAGASLVQVYTGFIYEGPAMVKNINKQILQASS